MRHFGKQINCQLRYHFMINWLCAVLTVVHGGSSDEQGSSTEGMGHAVCVRRGAVLGRRRH